MSNALLPVNVNELPVGKYVNEESFSDLAKSVDWLPRLDLFSSASDVCKKGEFPLNHWGFVVGKNITDLTTEVDVIPIKWRPKATLIKGKEVTNAYNPNDPEFQRIDKLVKDKVQNSGAMVGPEFLIYIPSIRRFASYHARNTSAKMIAGDIKKAMDENRAVTLGSQFVQGKVNSWQAPTISNCSTPFLPEELPSGPQVVDEVNKFCNPPESQKEVVEEVATGDQRVR